MDYFPIDYLNFADEYNQSIAITPDLSPHAWGVHICDQVVAGRRKESEHNDRGFQLA